MDSIRLKSGDVAPDFSLPNEDNVEISLRDLGENLVILYFYPKDNTSGCTTEALEFSELKPEFEGLGAVILGVSPDKTQTHREFIDSKSLKVILLSDVEKKVASKYGAFGKKMMYGKESVGIIRSTFIIKEGKILHSFYNVKAKGHAKKMLDVCKNIEKVE